MAGPIGNKNRQTHGDRNSAEYCSWNHMRMRIKHPPSETYRSLDIDPRWDNYSVFLTDMGRKPTPQHSIERIDNAKGYWPSNCIWGTPKQQMLNRKRWVHKEKQEKHAVIRHLWACGEFTQANIAEVYQICRSHVSDIVNNRRKYVLGTGRR